MKKVTFPIREIIKWAIVVLVLVLSLLHILGNKAIWAPLDSYCPFGGLESAWKLVSQGNFLDKTQPSNLALGFGLIIVTLLFGGIFCGWICPLGTLQDGLNRIGRFFKLPQIKVPAKLDNYLRWLRYFILGLVLLESFQLMKLWFADFDPFRIIFGLHWIFDPSSIVVLGWIIGGTFIMLSLFVNRFWCKYLCPLGLVIQWISKISCVKLRWHQSECINCDACIKKCPLALQVKSPGLNASLCNDCLECVAHCPKPSALTYHAPFGKNVKVALAGVSVFMILIVTAQLIGWWNPKITSDPASIKGWMTLGYISETYHIPLSELKKELNLPASTDEKIEIRSFEKSVPNFEVDVIRNFVAKWVGKPLLEVVENSVPVTREMEKSSETDGSEEPIRLNHTLTPKPVPTPSTKIITPSVITSNRDPEEIKGTMTLMEVSEGWNIPVETLLEKLGIAKDVNVNLAIREMESNGINGEKVRVVVKEILQK